MSQPKRFTASTLQEAYRKVRDEMGGDAIVLSTRKVLTPGVVGEPAHEVVEVRARMADASDPSFEASTAMHDMLRRVAEETATGMPLDPAVELAPAFLSRQGARLARGPFASLTTQPETPPASQPAPVEVVAQTAPATESDHSAETPSRPLTAPRKTADRAPAVDVTGVAGLTLRVDQLRALVESMAIERMGERANQSPALRAALERLEEQDMTPAASATVLARVESLLTRSVTRDAGLRALNRALAAVLPAHASPAGANGPRAVVLVGPAGAGKTTLAMRLALDLKRQGRRVMVASTDVSRAGAPQQLDAMGAALDVPVTLCYAPADVAALLDGGTLDAVIVDTAGHMGGRRDRLAELAAMLRPLTRRDVLLTLPATMRAVDQRDVVTAYQPYGVTGLAITRCDETSRYGGTASAAIEASLGVAYTTHSDLVTEPVRPGDPRALAAAVTTGRWVAGNVAVPARALARAS